MKRKTLKIIIAGVEVVVGVVILLKELFKKEEENHDSPGITEEK